MEVDVMKAEALVLLAILTAATAVRVHAVTPSFYEPYKAVLVSTVAGIQDRGEWQKIVLETARFMDRGEWA